jgi:alpha-beta hydrolase superfamily lysophospholipase
MSEYADSGRAFLHNERRNLLVLSLLASCRRPFETGGHLLPTVVGQSVGSVLAATWVHDYGPRIRSMVLASPAFSVKLYVPFARPALR